MTRLILEPTALQSDFCRHHVQLVQLAVGGHVTPAAAWIVLKIINVNHRSMRADARRCHAE